MRREEKEAILRRDRLPPSKEEVEENPKGASAEDSIGVRVRYSWPRPTRRFMSLEKEDERTRKGGRK